MKKSFLFAALVSIFCISCSEENAETVADVLKPAACFSWPAQEYKVGTEIQFTNCSANSTLYAWSFGDEGVSSQQEPSHVFAKQGTYEIELLAGEDLNDDGVLDMLDEPDVLKKSIVILPNILSLELTILSTGSWSIDNPIYTPVPDAVVSLYKEYPVSSDLGEPDYVLTSDSDGKLRIYDKEIDVKCFIVEKDGESNLINGYTIGGLFQTQEEIDGSVHFSDAVIGSYKFIDINQDGILDDSDKGVCEYVTVNVSFEESIIRDVFIGK